VRRLDARREPVRAGSEPWKSYISVSIVYQVTLFALICVIRGQTGRNFRAFRVFRGRTQTGTRTDYVACRISRNAFAKFST
jgi:hypothetical protein